MMFESELGTCWACVFFVQASEASLRLSFGIPICPACEARRDGLRSPLMGSGGSSEPDLSCGHRHIECRRGEWRVENTLQDEKTLYLPQHRETLPTSSQAPQEKNRSFITVQARRGSLVP